MRNIWETYEKHMRNTLTYGYHISILWNALHKFRHLKGEEWSIYSKIFYVSKAFTMFYLNGFMLDERCKNGTKEINAKCVSLCNWMIIAKYKFRLLSIDANNGKW